MATQARFAYQQILEPYPTPSAAVYCLVYSGPAPQTPASRSTPDRVGVPCTAAKTLDSPQDAQNQSCLSNSRPHQPKAAVAARIACMQLKQVCLRHTAAFAVATAKNLLAMCWYASLKAVGTDKVNSRKPLLLMPTLS